MKNKWPQIKLGDVCTSQKGLTYKSEDYASRDDGQVFITLKCIAKGGGFNTEGVKYIKKSEKSDKLHAGDLIIANTDLTRAGDVIGAPLFVPKLNGENEYIYSMDISKLEVDNSKLDQKYLYQYLLTMQVRNYMRGISSGSTVLHLKLKSVDKLSIPLPSMAVQQKISYFLSSIDEVIKKTEQIIQKTDELKNGLMNEFLTKGIGHTEFKKTKIGEIPESWQVVLLEKITRRGSGHTPNKKISAYWNGGIKWVSLSDTSRLDKIYISETSKEISTEGIRHSSAVLHPVGTVVLSRDAGVGKSAITTIPMAVSQHFIAWRCGKRLQNIFLYYLLQSWKPRFENIATGTTIKTIGLQYFKKMEIALPSIEEQKRIADILFSCDDKITKNIKQKLSLIDLKNGLMHDIFSQNIAFN